MPLYFLTSSLLSHQHTRSFIPTPPFTDSSSLTSSLLSHQHTRPFIPTPPFTDSSFPHTLSSLVNALVSSSKPLPSQTLHSLTPSPLSSMHPPLHPNPSLHRLFIPSHPLLSRQCTRLFIQTPLFIDSSSLTPSLLSHQRTRLFIQTPPFTDSSFPHTLSSLSSTHPPLHPNPSLHRLFIPSHPLFSLVNAPASSSQPLSSQTLHPSHLLLSHQRTRLFIQTSPPFTNASP